MIQLRAISASMTVLPLLRMWDFRARLLAGFEHACNFVMDEAVLVALVTPQVGNGPFHVVVEGSVDFRLLPARSLLRSHGNRLVLDPPSHMSIDLASCRAWDAHPDWQAVRKSPYLGLHRVTLTNFLQQYAPSGSLAAQLQSPRPAPWVLAARNAIGQIEVDLNTALAGLLGLGPGLTPSGDDWLAGWLAGMQVCLPPTRSFALGHLVAQAARTRTNLISRSYLQAAAAGRLAQPWHVLFSALAQKDPAPVCAAAQGILQFGATSGADMLSGFLAGLAKSQP